MSKIKDNLILIFGILIICIVFLLGKSCGNKKSENILKPNITTITHYRDTIFPKDTIYVYNIKPGKSKIVHDTAYKVVYMDSTECNTVRFYEDSTITDRYNIYSKKYIQGKFLTEARSVKLKVPLIIKDSVVIKKDSLIFKPAKYEVKVGVLASFNMLAPVGELSINKCSYLLGYDPFNKQPIIGFKYRLFNWTPKNKK